MRDTSRAERVPRSARVHADYQRLNEQAAAARRRGTLEPSRGLGDGCAVLAEPAPGWRTVVTTDTPVEDQDWRTCGLAASPGGGGQSPFWNPPA